MSKRLFYFVLVFVKGETMKQSKDIQRNALCSGVKSPAVMLSLFPQTAPDIGFLSYLFPRLIKSRQIQRGGNYVIPDANKAVYSALHEKQDVWNVIEKAVVGRLEGLQVCSEASFS
jgi:hypothetical protein